MPYGRATPIVLSEPERTELESLTRRRNAPQGLALRARIVLRCAEGLTNQAVANEVSASGASGSPQTGSPACRMSPGAARRAGSGTRRSPRSSPAPWR